MEPLQPYRATAAEADLRRRAEKRIKRKRELRQHLTSYAIVMAGLWAIWALTSRGYTVHEASSGAEALEVYESLEGKIDIVVSDVVMPEMDGPTLLGELRKRNPDIKFVFVSGYAEDAFAKNLPADAKFGFLPKPFSLKQLATVVKDTIEQ